MPDDLIKQGRADDIRISTQSWEIYYWSRKLKVTPFELKEALKNAGKDHTVGNVRRILNK